MSSSLREMPRSLLLGNQGPRFSSVPAFRSSLGEAIVDFAGEAGLYLDPWQKLVLVGASGLKPGGRWAARTVGLLVPRQNGKGSILEARELYAMFAGDERLIVHSAHRYDTSQLHFQRLMELIEGNPDLDRHVKRVSRISGKEQIELRNGCELKFKARTKSGGGRGFSSDLLVLDEAFLLPEESVAAMMPTLVARKNPQVWFTSSAGYPDSAALWRVVEMGRAKASGIAYFEWGNAADADMSDEVVWAAANPGYGIRIAREALQLDFDLMTAEDFAREHGGVWDPNAIMNALINAVQWSTLLGERPSPDAFAVDVSYPDSAFGSIGVADAGCVELVEHRRGTDWLVGRSVELDRMHGPSRWVVDPTGPAGPLVASLEAAGLDVVQMSTRDVANASAEMVSGVAEGLVRHVSSPPLDAAVGFVRKRPLGDGAFAFGRKPSAGDISPLTAVTFASWAARNVPAVNVLKTIW